jgi:hypothetical protein
MELQVGCRCPVEHHGPGLVRYRLTGKLVKGQPLGGVHDDWVVIEPAYQAATLAEQLHDNPVTGHPCWVGSTSPPATTGSANGSTVPPASVSAWHRSRTAVSTSGCCAASLHSNWLTGQAVCWRQRSFCTMSAPPPPKASRPGGAQAELLAEINQDEQQRNLDLLWTEFRNYQQGILPAGPGAGELTDFFTHVDQNLGATDKNNHAVKVQRTDRDVLNLLSKRAKSLQLGTANYCWFTDPSRVLCLKLARTPTADRPLVRMCDWARCPQATHHQVHRPVWVEHAERTKTFLGQLGTNRVAERDRLTGDYNRALRVIAEIDAATTSDKEART